MEIKDISFQAPEDNLIFDEMLLGSAEDGSAGEALRFWESPVYFVVLGRTSSRAEDVNEGAVEKDGVRVLRRVSAGGTVLQGPGCLNYSMVLSYDRGPGLRNIKSSYESVFGYIILALGALGITAKWEPVSDLSCEGKKFSGNAQARRRKYFLHHGTILYGFSVPLIERYLKIPGEAPAYRVGRGHTDFVTNISMDPEGFKRELVGQLTGVNAYA